jgi:hypothetical protein
MKRTLTLLLLSMSVSAVCFAQKAKIRLNLKQDSTYYLNQVSNLTITQDIPDHKQVITTVVTGVVAHKVTAIKDTVYELAVQYESFGMKMDMAGTTLMSFDTKNSDSQDIMTKVMRGMLHKPITITMTRSGKILEVKNLDNLYAGMFARFPELADAQKAQIKAQAEKSFGEKAFRNNIQDAFAVLPDAVVGVNDSWLSDSNLETIAVAKIKTTYVLKNITDHDYVIHGDAVVTSAGMADYVQFNGMPMRYNNVKGTYSVEIKLDKATGWVTNSKTSKNITGDMEIKDNPKIPGGITFPMAIVGDVNLSNK